MKTDVTFIRDLVEQEILKNPNGLVSIPFASKMENYLFKFWAVAPAWIAKALFPKEDFYNTPIISST